MRRFFVPLSTCAFAAGLLLASCTLLIAAEEPAITPEQEVFFESKIRPLLVTHCIECHGAAKQESGLRLDSRTSLLAGGATGEVAAIPGDADKSLLMRVVRHQGDIQMPPEKKLDDADITLLATWVSSGLPWPKSAEGAPKPLSTEEKVVAARTTMWSLQPIVDPPLPAVKQADWPRAKFDHYVLARLEAAGLTPSPEAPRATWLRRVSFDLTGLPPTAEEVANFEADQTPQAYETVVERLLASPRYGERWARHWLDVARYGDTRGYAFQKERKYPYSYTYRDYVINAFNNDLPYDRFVKEQIAADLLPDHDSADLAALGLLTTGRRFNRNEDDIDDLIDVVTRGFLGLSVACARCHDHKYDAIPTDDYYSLYGVFASIEEPGELPLIGEPTENEAYSKFMAELEKRQAAARDYESAEHAKNVTQAVDTAADYLARIAAGGNSNLLDKLSFLALKEPDIRPRLLERWKRYLDENAKDDHATLGVWKQLATLKEDEFTTAGKEKLDALLARGEGTDAGQINPLLKAALEKERPTSGVQLARTYGELLKEVVKKYRETGANKEAFDKLAPPEKELAKLVVDEKSPPQLPREEAGRFLSRAQRNRFQELERQAKTLEATSPAAPPRAMAVVERPQPNNPRVFIRGNPGRPGKAVPRQYLAVLSPSERVPYPQKQSGRLELANEITSPENPLTRRVIINRLWMYHFGEPLVGTPSDFGIRAEVPTQPEVLDSLSTLLLEKGWSLKAIHREIVLSATYRQVSSDREDGRAIDPENRLLWRMNRRRLEWEPMRDTLLFVSGSLDTTMGGRPVELTGNDPSNRRAVYGFIDRQDLPNLFRVFDIASPDQHAPRRPRTTVPQQALFLMNNPFVIKQAQAIVTSVEKNTAASRDERVTAMYQMILARKPDDVEMKIATDFIEQSSQQEGGEVKLNAWQQLAQLLLLTNELAFVD